MLHVVYGVGNPGPRYAATRHNLGFRVVDALAAAAGRPTRRFKGLAAEGIGIRVTGAPVLLVKPLTYVNRCGPLLRRICEMERVDLARALVVLDDVFLPAGRIRLRLRGSDGGHKGLRSLVAALGTEGFPRLRIGIGQPGARPLERFVLEPVPPKERAPLERAVGRAADAVRLWVRLGGAQAMAQVNRPDLDPPGVRV